MRGKVAILLNMAHDVPNFQLLPRSFSADLSTAAKIDRAARELEALRLSFVSENEPNEIDRQMCIACEKDLRLLNILWLKARLKISDDLPSLEDCAQLAFELDLDWPEL